MASRRRQPVASLLTSSCINAEESLEECLQSREHAVLLRAMTAMGREARHRRQDLRDGGATGRDGAVSEGLLNERLGLLRLETLVSDDRVELGLAAGRDERLP